MTREDALRLLDLPKNASQDDIKKAYRKLAKAVHPDTGGTNGMFSLLNEVNDILTGRKAESNNSKTTARKPQSEPDQAQQEPRPTLYSVRELAAAPDFVIPPASAERIFLRNMPTPLTYKGYIYTLDAPTCLLTGIKFQLQAELQVRFWTSRLDKWRGKKPEFQTDRKLTFNSAPGGGMDHTVCMKHFNKGLLELTLTGHDAKSTVRHRLTGGTIPDETVSILPPGAYPPLMTLHLKFI